MGMVGGDDPPRYVAGVVIGREMTTHLPFRVEALVHHPAMRWPNHTALINGERRWTYAQLYAAVLVESGLEPASIVVSTEMITDDLIITFLACCHADFTFLPFHRD